MNKDSETSKTTSRSYERELQEIERLAALAEQAQAVATEAAKILTAKIAALKARVPLPLFPEQRH